MIQGTFPIWESAFDDFTLLYLTELRFCSYLYIEIELLLLFFAFEYRQYSSLQEQADESSRLIGVDYSCLL
jgi:hypothetical protein